MKTTTYLKTLFAASLLVPAGCDVKDPIYNTPHPEKGTITLTTDWSGVGEGLAAPASYTVAADGYTATLSGAVNLLDYLFAPGKYSVFAYNAPEHIAVSGATASVAAATPPAGQPGAFVHPTPGWLFASATDALIEADTDHTLTAVMQQQVRELTLIIEPTGETAGSVESITGTLSGVASSLDFAGGTHGAPANVALTFTRIADGANAGRWSATVRLLGTAGAEQRLAGTIAFTGNSPAPVPIDSDLSKELAAFNTDKRTSLTLGGSVVETPTGAGFTATITDWKTVDGGEVSAD